MKKTRKEFVEERTNYWWGRPLERTANAEVLAERDAEAAEAAGHEWEPEEDAAPPGPRQVSVFEIGNGVWLQADGSFWARIDFDGWTLSLESKKRVAHAVCDAYNRLQAGELVERGKLGDAKMLLQAETRNAMEAAGALSRLAREAGVPDEGPDEIVGDVLMKLEQKGAGLKAEMSLSAALRVEVASLRQANKDLGTVLVKNSALFARLAEGASLSDEHFGNPEKIVDAVLKRLESAGADAITVEESDEILGELKMALAVLAGEDLEFCGDPTVPSECPGHLGPKAREAYAAALAAWRALQEGNRRAVRERDGFRDRLDGILRVIYEQQKDEEPALDTLRRIIQERDGANLRLKHTHAEAINDILQAHQGETEPSTVDTLKRIIRERDDFQIDRNEWQQRAEVRCQRFLIATRDKVAAERENRELRQAIDEGAMFVGIKSEEIRSLRGRLARARAYMEGIWPRVLSPEVASQTTAAHGVPELYRIITEADPKVT